MVIGWLKWEPWGTLAHERPRKGLRSGQARDSLKSLPGLSAAQLLSNFLSHHAHDLHLSTHTLHLQP